MNEIDQWDRIMSDAEGERESLVDLCRRLVAAVSVNPPGDTRGAAAAVTDFLTARGIVSEQVAAVPTMPSVVATVDSGRPGPHLVLNGHLDTMPAGEERLWSVDPYTLTRVDGRLYGLGMGNMKGGVAALAHALDLLNRSRETWTGRVTLTAVSDEVAFGDHGAAHLLATRSDLQADALLCAEGPGFRRLAIGEKGLVWLRLEVAADGGHSSAASRGTSAAARLSAAVTAIDGLTGIRGRLPGIPLADEGSSLELTANVGTLEAGTFIGQIAVSGAAEMDLRIPPGITAAEAEELTRGAIARAIPDADFTLTRIKGWDPNATSPDSRLGRAFRAAWGKLFGGGPEYTIRLPASDASRWRALGTDALCFGPQPTHSAGIDDYADEDEVIRCTALYAATALAYLGGTSPTGEDG
ncbi:M20 family metallopeptidase [Leifsonia sp. AG29]|uniref:M20 family metallopeptidase n=1 Tax=Leifsonia sp. AG29 TaxID=2598860 RepID=UPI00131CC198|nr:M20/M25/M40 family metallo-hydrolase [Leifsonia sp. AG29]